MCTRKYVTLKCVHTCTHAHTHTCMWSQLSEVFLVVRPISVSLLVAFAIYHRDPSQWASFGWDLISFRCGGAFFTTTILHKLVVLGCIKWGFNTQCGCLVYSAHQGGITQHKIPKHHSLRGFQEISLEGVSSPRKVQISKLPCSWKARNSLVKREGRNRPLLLSEKLKVKLECNVF